MRLSSCDRPGRHGGSHFLTDARYDVFLSYPRADAARLEPLRGALRGHGLTVFVDEAEIEPFRSIPDSIRLALARSVVLVAYYSLAYRQSRACQWEILTAYLAGQSRQPGLPQVLILNPEPNRKHIPEALGADRFLAPQELADPDATASLVARRVAEVDQVIGQLVEVHPPEFSTGAARHLGSPRFLGRLDELWQINQLLHADYRTATSGTSHGGTAVIQALAGTGKSVLVAEYAQLFAAAYPGGIFWLNGQAAADAGDGAVPAGALQSQLRLLAEQLGSVDPGRPDDARSQLEHHIEGQACCLWVVEDLAAGLKPEDFTRWLAPHPKAKTLITTESHDYDGLAAILELENLSSDDAYALLTLRQRPRGAAATAAARKIAEAVGGHAGTLDVLAAQLEAGLSYAQLLERIEKAPVGDEAAVLRTSIAQLPEEGRDLLRLASVLAKAAIADDLVTAAFGDVLELSPADAQERMLKALSQLRAVSMAEPADDSEDAEQAESETPACRVSAYVARQMGFPPLADPGRTDRLKEAVVKAVAAELSRAADDPSAKLRLDPGAVHARALCSRPASPAQVALMGEIGRYDLSRGDYASAETLFAAQLVQLASGADQPNAEALKAGRLRAWALFNLGRRDEAETEGREVVEAWEQLGAGEAGDRLQAEGDYAAILAQRGRLEEAAQRQRHVYEGLKAQVEADDPLLIEAGTGLGSTLALQGRLDEAQQLMQWALEASLHRFGELHDRTCGARQSLAGLLRLRGDLRTARVLLESAQAAGRKVYGPNHPKTLVLTSTLSEVLRELGELKKAEELSEQAWSAWRERLGDQHPSTLEAWHSHLGILTRTDAAQAAALRDQLLEIYAAMHPDEPPDVLPGMARLVAQLMSRGESDAARTLNTQLISACDRVTFELSAGTVEAVIAVTEVLGSQGEWEDARSLLERLLTSCRARQPDARRQELRVIFSLGSIRLMEGDVPGARPLLEEVLAARRADPGEEDPDTLTAYAAVATALRALGELEATRRCLDWVLSCRRTAVGEDHLQTILIKVGLAEVLLAMGSREEADQLQQEALASLRRQDQNSPDCVQAKIALAEIMKQSGAVQAAVALQEEATRSRERELGRDHPATLEARAQLASILVLADNSARAEQMLKVALEALMALGSQNPLTLNVKALLGQVQLNLGDAAAAEAIHAEVAEALSQRYGDEHPVTLAVRAMLAGDLAALGRLDEAGAMLQGVLDAQRQLLGDQNLAVAESRLVLAEILSQRSQLPRARSLQEEALATVRRLCGESSLTTLQVMTGLARVMGMQGDAREAQPLLRQCIEMATRLLGAENSMTLRLRVFLAPIMAQSGDPAGARSGLAETLAVLQRTAGEEALATLEAKVALAQITMGMGDFDTARGLLATALPACQQKLGDDSMLTIQAKDAMAGAAWPTKDWRTAMQLKEEVVAAMERKYGPSDPMTVGVRAQLDQARKIAAVRRFVN